MEITKALGLYFKLALLLSVVVILLELSFQSGSYLNFQLKRWTNSFPFEFYMIERGGNERKDNDHGAEYYDKLRIKVYNKEEGLNFKLKNFTVNHIRHWEAGMFM